jgi:hypothetical protein
MDSGGSGVSSSGGDGSSAGQGGSMARFCILGDNLFTVDMTSLNMFNISNPKDPFFMEERTQKFPFGIETIFPMDSLLFIGSQTGMYIYHISQYGFLEYLSTTEHIRSCDPVVAQGDYAYVTLNSNNVGCGRTSNVLQIYDISDLTHPIQVKEVFGFSSPMGLGIDGNKLFVCDRGLKMYDVTVYDVIDEVSNSHTDSIAIKQIADLYTAGIQDVFGAYDVIPVKGQNGLLILVTSSGIYQLDYSGRSGKKLSLLSTIEVKKEN